MSTFSSRGPTQTAFLIGCRKVVRSGPPDPTLDGAVEVGVYIFFATGLVFYGLVSSL